MASLLGQQAPEFSAKTNSGKDIKLSEFQGQKNVVLILYPGDQTSDCTKQLCAFRDEFPRFQSADTEVFGVNPADAESHQRFIDKNGFPFELIVDVDREIARLYDSIQLMGFMIKRTVVGINKSGKVVFFKRGLPSNNEILEAFEASQ